MSEQEQKAPRVRVVAIGFQHRVPAPGAMDANLTSVASPAAEIERTAAGFVVRFKLQLATDPRQLFVPFSNVAWVQEDRS